MITATPLSRQQPAAPTTWQQEFADSITDPAELADILHLPSDWLAGARAAAASFGLRVPRSFVNRMRVGDINDPLLRQVLPIGAELDRAPGYVSDPLQENDAGLAPGLLKKYAHRALLITTEACAVHCRYCFRREFPYADQQGDLGRWREAISAIAADDSIREVILSGGDPLSLTNARLKSLTDALRGIAHIEWLRIHTRNAIVLPSRVDDSFVDWIASLAWRVTVVLHVNHANELQGDAADAISKLRSTGALLLNQAVLLRGVNDEAETLVALSKRLYDLGVAPYYLHLLDRVNGTAHFEVSEARGKELVTAMAEALPGFLVPKLAREMPGREAKTVLAAGL
jgi:EF-P beta-lysylation protein EpmB